jgi:5-methylcytosine-specific restriction endonuclease McrA
MRRLGVPPVAGPGRRYDWNEIRRFYEAGHSARECRQEFGFGRNAWADAVARGAIRPRPRLEPLDSILAAGRRRSRHHVKLRLLEAGLKQARCEDCGLSDWLGKPLSLELHHVNGDGMDNRVENLMLLCPNCHSQTTWGGRNKGRTRDAGTGRDKSTPARASRPPPVGAAALR